MTHISKEWLGVPIIETTTDIKIKYGIFCNNTCVGVLLLSVCEYERMLRELCTTPYYLRINYDLSEYLI